jgi:RNA polymerase sigma-70 factor (ECF subfamily)
MNATIGNDVVARAQAGEEAALRSLVDTFSRDVFRLAYRITRNEEDAEDTVQETFIRAFQKLSSFEERSRFGTWLYRITANTAIDVLRKQKRLHDQSAPLSPEAHGIAPGQERHVFNRQIHDRVERALETLTELERTAFVLRHYEKRPIAEIEEMLSISKNGAKQAIFRAVIAGIARGEGDPELQRKAIRYLGVYSSDRNVGLLAELYDSLTSVEARREVLRSFMIAGERVRLLEVAKTDRDDELRRRAVRHLGALGAEAALAEMYESESSIDVKKSILQAWMVAGAAEPLLAVAQNRAESEELRESAVRLLGASGASDQLWALYQSEPSQQIKKRILRALFVAGETERLASVARDVNEPEELRKAAIHDLGVSGARSRSILVSVYENEPAVELKERVLHALFLQSADTELIEIARAEPDPELKKEAVHWLSRMGTDVAKDFLLELLQQ